MSRCLRLETVSSFLRNGVYLCCRTLVWTPPWECWVISACFPLLENPCWPMAPCVLVILAWSGGRSPKNMSKRLKHYKLSGPIYVPWSESCTPWRSQTSVMMMQSLFGSWLTSKSIVHASFFFSSLCFFLLLPCHRFSAVPSYFIFFARNSAFFVIWWEMAWWKCSELLRKQKVSWQIGQGDHLSNRYNLTKGSQSKVCVLELLLLRSPKYSNIEHSLFCMQMLFWTLLLAFTSCPDITALVDRV